MKKKIVFIAGNLTQPRFVKRLKSFISRGYEVEVYGFDRGVFQNINQLPSSVKVHNLGQITSGKNYIKSFFYHFKVLYPVFSQHKDKTTLFYTLGFFPALVASVFVPRRFIYEISDLIYGYFPINAIISIFRLIDISIIKRSYLTVLTSEGFEKYLFPKQKTSNTLVVPNKLDETFLGKRLPQNRISNSSIRFSFIGFLRYPDTIFRFARIIGEHFHQHKFIFYGDSDLRDEVKELANKYANIYFLGKFRNPEDLERIYDSIDVVVACYDTITFNERVAEPNKLYESMYFSKPIVVSENTFLAERVLEYQCGYIINPKEDTSIIDFISELSIDNVNAIMDRINAINENEMVDNPEHILKTIERTQNKT